MKLVGMLMVSTSTSGIMYTDVVYRSCKVEIAGKELQMDLILLDIRDFDVILMID